MTDFFLLAAGFLLAAVGGDLFVRGVIGLAHWARLPAGFAASTLAAFATSSPELLVGLNAALAGRPQLSLGDTLGSNVVNVSLILGIAAALASIGCPRGGVRRDFPVALAVPILTGLLALDGFLSRTDGLFMAGLFFAWLAVSGRNARRQRALLPVAADNQRVRIIARSLGGLALLFAAGRLIVQGGSGIAFAAGWDPFLVGALIVSVGTSIPELATTLMSRIRHNDEVGLGTLLGSNIFNGLFIVPLVMIISPFAVDVRAVAPVLAFGVAALACAYPVRDCIPRSRGLALLALFAAYFVFTSGLF